MALPLIKVAALIVKSASKPIAKKIKNQAARSPLLHRYIIAGARFWHRLEGKMQIFVGERSKTVKELNPQAAIDLGAELISEGFLLSVAIGLLLLENSRSSTKEETKKAELEKRLQAMENQIELQRREIEGLKNAIILTFRSVQEEPPINIIEKMSEEKEKVIPDIKNDNIPSVSISILPTK
jgi:chaperonin cofactor prefoldin